METVSVGELAAQGVTAERGENRLVVLVVDGEPAVADAIADVLRRSDFCAMAAYRAETALQDAAMIPPDLMIIDILLPGMNGIELAMIMEKEYPRCRVLLLTADAGAEGLLEMMRKEGRTFPVLMKPMYPADVLFAMAGPEGTRWRKQQSN